MLVFEIYSTSGFELHGPLSHPYLHGFVLKFLTFLETRTPPENGYYREVSGTVFPGLSIKFCDYVSD